MAGDKPHRELRVLVIEDNDDDVQLVLIELRRGYALSYRHVDNPGDLKDALATGSWDVIICDWSLPELNALGAFRMVRDTGLDIPFIIVSGTIEEEHAVEALRVGVHDFMTKGRFARLRPAIDRELREAETRRQKRLADRDLVRQREEIERSEQLLRSVLQTVPDGVVVVDALGNVMEWSAAVDAILGLPRAGIELTDWPQHYGLHRSDRTTLLGRDELAIVRALAGEEIDRQEIYVQNAGVPKGSWIRMSGRALRGPDGAISGAVSVLHDITREKQAQEQLMISDRMASVGMLAAGVAHEINNPLGAALLNLEILHELLLRPKDQRDDGEVQESMGDARSAVARVREIVGDLRIFSRHDDPADTRADVKAALESSLRMAFNEIRHSARLVRDYGPVPRVTGSEGRLGQVLLNLVVNAAQAIPEGNADENEIRVSTRTAADGMVVIDVTDTGSGIPAENIPNLFLPFFTTKPAGIGTGLGLPICQRIITQMGGRIEVESQVGQGTTFRVVLPPAREETPVPREPIASRAPRSSRRGRILVVDDEPMLASAIRRVLASHHDVVTTTRAEDALERLRAGASFDVIFSDLMMPRITGMELYARICEEFPEQAPRVVFLTGGAFTQAAREFLARVPNPTLEKPIDRNGLLALVSERVSSPTPDLA